MTGKTYYIDPENGNDSQSGQSPSEPLKTWNGQPFQPGDTVLFKRNSIIRDVLRAGNGSELGVITYGAYGNGAKPVFLGSTPADGQNNWTEERPGIWRFTGPTFPSEVCNLVFNNGDSCGNLRWNRDDLHNQGEWYYSLLGQTRRNKQNVEAGAGGELYLCSSSNPGSYYDSIECSLWGKEDLARGHHYLKLENLVFRNSGIHGFHGMFGAEHITIRDCEFHCIGGAVWRYEKRIRLGNAIQFWDGGKDILVENCIFENIYDSGVTHQGGPPTTVPERIHFRNNLFVNCGMAAYECREPAAREVYFEQNTCINAGGGFSMQGEPAPRSSDIHPQPMGHHIFIWKIEKGSMEGTIYIRNNVFFEAPHGAAIYSIIDPLDEQHFAIDNNCYRQEKGNILIRMNGKNYPPADFASYQQECGQDANSLISDPLFANLEQADFRLQKNSPCPRWGKQT